MVFTNECQKYIHRPPIIWNHLIQKLVSPWMRLDFEDLGNKEEILNHQDFFSDNLDMKYTLMGGGLLPKYIAQLDTPDHNGM